MWDAITLWQYCFYRNVRCYAYKLLGFSYSKFSTSNRTIWIHLSCMLFSCKKPSQHFNWYHSFSLCITSFFQVIKSNIFLVMIHFTVNGQMVNHDNCISSILIYTYIFRERISQVLHTHDAWCLFFYFWNVHPSFFDNSKSIFSNHWIIENL